MTIHSISRQELLDSFSSLEAGFKSSLAEAVSLENQFDEARDKLNDAMSARLQRVRESFPESNPLQAQLRNFAVALKETQEEWNDKAAGRAKFVAFREGFEDSLLVFVNGKVKSGKSSLGNYMAWGNTDPTDAIRKAAPAGFRPKYKSHEKVDTKGGDAEKEAEKNLEFRVGATEATSSIQSFSLPGLTWVDSPGLHSLNAANGNLAKEYLDHADLILYSMKSDSPGRASDLHEIKDLFRKGKKTVLLLTGSDDTDDDVDANGNLVQSVVMKDEDRRSKQRDYVKGELEKLSGEENTKHIEIVSISARYAQDHPDSAKHLQDSGLGGFFVTLQNICQSQGVQIKRRVPMNNLRNFLVECESNLQPYQSLLEEFEEALQGVEKKLAQQKKTQLVVGRKKLRLSIDQFFDSLEPHRDDAEQVSRQLAKFEVDIRKQYQTIIADQLKSIFDALIPEFQSAIKNTYQENTLGSIPNFRLDKIVEKIEDGTRSGTKRRNAGIGSLLGAGIGFLVGGPVGAAAGAAIGGGLGSMSGDEASIGYRNIEIISGDNLDVIRKQTQQSYGDALEAQLAFSADELWQELETAFLDLVVDLNTEIKEFGNKLKKIQQQVDTSLQ